MVNNSPIIVNIKSAFQDLRIANSLIFFIFRKILKNCIFFSNKNPLNQLLFKLLIENGKVKLAFIVAKFF